MGVTSVERHVDGSSGSIDLKSIEYSVKYRAYVSSPLDGVKTVLEYFYNNGPWLGQLYSYGNDSGQLTYCDKISVPERVKGSDSVWELTVHYKTPDQDSNQISKDTNGDYTINPLDFRPQISFGFAHYPEIVTSGTYRGGFTHNPARLADGDVVAITNSAFEPFDPPIERDSSRTVWRIKTNQLIFDVDDAQFHIDTVNRFDMQVQPWINASGSIPALKGKIMAIEGNPKTATIGNAIIDYYEVMVEIHVNRYGWRDTLLDRGFHRGAWPGAPDGRGGTISETDLPAGVPRLAAILDFDGMPVQKPVLLNGAGFPKAETDKTVYAGTWQKYSENAFLACKYLKQALRFST